MADPEGPRPPEHLVRVVDLLGRALCLIEWLHSDGVLSERQICQALGLDHVSFHVLLDDIRHGNDLPPDHPVGQREAGARDNPAPLTQQGIATPGNRNSGG